MFHSTSLTYLLLKYIYIKLNTCDRLINLINFKTIYQQRSVCLAWTDYFKILNLYLYETCSRVTEIKFKNCLMLWSQMILPGYDFSDLQITIESENSLDTGRCLTIKQVFLALSHIVRTPAGVCI